MPGRLTKFAGTAAALTLCISPTMAAAATSMPATSLNPLIAVSVFGTPASAQEVCSNAADAAAAAGAAAAAQGQAGCVLPAVDAPPPPPTEAPPPSPKSFGLGIPAVLAGLLGIAALAALIASGNEEGGAPISPS